MASGELADFEQRTGITVTYERFGGDPTAEDELASTGLPRDLAEFGPASTLREVAATGRLVDLNSFLDRDEARAQFGDYVVDATSVDDGYFGVPISSGLKGIVWYPLHEFAAAGYSAPRSWDELVSLSRRMVADGRTPWCIGFESEAFSGWPGTDWIEGLVLRLGGVDFYDRWMAGEVSFEDPVVRDAFTRFGEIAFADRFVRYGTDAISRTSHFDAMDHLATDPPGCWMNYTGSWQQTNVRDATGGDAGFFVLPPIEPGGDAPVLGAPFMIGAIRDRPEVREFVRWLLDPEWGANWAATPNGSFFSANIHFDPDNCRSPELSRRGERRAGATLRDPAGHHRRRAATPRRVRRDAGRDRRVDRCRPARCVPAGDARLRRQRPGEPRLGAARHRRRLAVAAVLLAHDVSPRFRRLLNVPEWASPCAAATVRRSTGRSRARGFKHGAT